MEEIKVGEYGRTNLGKIFIFAWLEVNGKRVENKVILGDGQKITNEFYYFEKGEEIVKQSPNILNILEIGDYVNGEQIMCFRNADCDYDIGTEYNDEFGCYYGYDKEQIKDIVTHEQFEQMKYIVGDESNG